MKPASFRYKPFFFTVLMIPFLTCCSLGERGEYMYNEGGTQGTSYHIVYQSPKSIDLHDSLKNIFHRFDLSLSSYIPNSIISKVNRNEDVNIDFYFAKVFKASREVYKQSEGLFDITVAPLVNAWGFGPERKLQMDKEIVDSLLEVIGMDKVKVAGMKVIKTDPRVKIDVNAIAQGYSCDIVADFLERMGVKNYLVEIGGEIVSRGHNAEGNTWRVGIDKPAEGNMIPGQELQAIVQLKNRGLATSGNYRKFIEENGVKYAHTINPKTGYPVMSNLLSATIVAKDCMTADAYATVCMVAGLEKSKEIIKIVGGLDAYLIYSDSNGDLKVFTTKGMDGMLGE